MSGGEDSSRRRPLKVGLTGPIGAGKTTVGRVFSVLRVPVYNADERAKALMESDDHLRAELERLLGAEAYVEGRLNRRKVAEVLFSDAVVRRRVEEVVHAAVFDDFRRWAAQHPSAPYVLMEAALIFESGAVERIPLDYVIFVDAPEAVRWERLRRYRGYSDEEIRRREAAQQPPEQKKQQADFVVPNDGESSIIARIWELHRILTQKATIHERTR